MKFRSIAPLGAIALILALAGCGSGSGGSSSSAGGDPATQAQSTDGEAVPTPAEVQSGSFHCLSIDVSTPEARAHLGFGGGVKYEDIGGTACTGDESKMPRSRSCLNPSGAFNRTKPACLPPLWVCDSGGGGWSAGEGVSAPARNNFTLRGDFCNPYTHT